MFSYGFFSLLVFRAWRGGQKERWRWSWALTAFFLAVALSAADELNQSRFLTGRGSVYCFGFDVLGCLMALGWDPSFRRSASAEQSRRRAHKMNFKG